MQASRRSQPYRKGMGTRAPGGALSAMLRGAPAFMRNPSHRPDVLTPGDTADTGGLSAQVNRRRKRKTKTPVYARRTMPTQPGMPAPRRLM